MSPITVTMFFMGRDEAYSEQCTLEIRRNAVETVRRVNMLYAAMAADGVEPAIDQHTGTPVASGWRPRAVNDRTKNSATGSPHLSAEGYDGQDHADRRIVRWCLRNLDKLEAIGLWMEDPQWCVALDEHGNEIDWWFHVQTRPPRSGRRVFIPSSAPPRAAKLPEQEVA